MKNSIGAAAPSRITIEVDEALCKGCGLCVAFCEEHVLELAPVPNGRGVYVARVVAAEACRGCCQCALVCPEAGLRLYRL